MKFHQDLLNCFQDLVPKRFCRKLLFYKVQRDITKTYKEELLFRCALHVVLCYLYEVSSSYLECFLRYRAESGHYFVTETVTDKLQRDIIKST